MRRRLWLGLAWLLLARAPGAPGGYPHLEGDVRWRRLFSSTHFFLRVDPGGRVEGTRWRHGQDSIVEIRSVHVGTVVIKAVYSGFYVAMNRRGRLYGSRVYSVDCRFRERIEENGYNTYASRRWRHHGRPMFLALDGQGIPRQGGLSLVLPDEVAHNHLYAPLQRTRLFSDLCKYLHSCACTLLPHA